MSDLKLSTGSFSSPEGFMQPNDGAQPNKKSGLGCVLIGCLSLFLLITVPIVGGLIYVSSLDEADYGGAFVTLMHQDWFEEAVREGVKADSKKSEEEKAMLLKGYEVFTQEYDKLSDEKKVEVNTALGKLFKKLISGDIAASQNFEKEMGDIFKVLQGGVTTAPDPTTSQPNTTPSTDPYSFDLPATTVPTTPTNTTQPSQYDF